MGKLGRQSKGVPEYQGTLVFAKLPRKYQCAWNSLRAQRYRCENPKDQKFKYYGGKGIEVRYSTRQFLAWWAANCAGIKKPSINRIDSNGHYEFGNVEIIEHSANVIESNRRTHKKQIVARHRKTKKYLHFESNKEAAEFFNISVARMSALVRGAKTSKVFSRVRNYLEYDFLHATRNTL